MSDSSEELTPEDVRDFLLKEYSFDVEAACKGLVYNPKFWAYLEHIFSLDHGGLFRDFLDALMLIAELSFGAENAVHLKVQVERNTQRRSDARDLLRQAADILGLPEGHYRLPDEPLGEKVSRSLLKSLPPVGKKGRATVLESANRGFAVRLVAQGIPESFPERYSLISDTLTGLGIQCSRQQARSIILKGRT